MRTTRTASLTIAVALAAILAIPTGALAQTAPAAPENQPPSQPAPAAQPGQVPQPPEGGVNWGGAGYAAGAVLCDIVYVPVKVLYALLGGIVGAGAFALTAGNTQVSNTIWRSSLGGDYVLTPAMIQGTEPINFSGPTETQPVNAPPASSPAQASPAPAPGTAMPAPPPSAAAAPAPAMSGTAQPADRGTGPVAPDRSIE